MADIEVRDDRGALRDVAKHDLIRRRQGDVRVEVAAGEQPGRAFGKRRVLREVEQVRGAERMPAAAARLRVPVLVPAGTGDRPGTHPRVVQERIEVVGWIGGGQRLAVVGKAVRRPGVVLAEEALHRAVHGGRVQQVGEHRNPGQQVVPQQWGSLVHAHREFGGHRVVEGGFEPRVEGEEAVRHVAPHLLVVEQDRRAVRDVTHGTVRSSIP